MALNRDGRLEVFGISPNGAVYSDVEISKGSGSQGQWSGWFIVGQLVPFWTFTAIDVGLNTAGDLQLFGISATDHTVYTSWQTTPGGDWSVWSSMGLSASAIRVGAGMLGLMGGAMELFAIGADHALYHTVEQSAQYFYPWTSLGGWVSDISVARTADRRLQVMAIGWGGTTWTNYQVSPGGSYSGWVAAGPIVQPGLITQAVDGVGHMVAFAIAPDGELEEGVPGDSWFSLGGGNV